ncbi:hypothetical protein [Streptomyces narbonensis]|uniref:hypothetical protein n=1 Tax=Streptomyces narbonensis TaxID=67333 RepID=UPI0016737810|nr:hypothetical protein [Streptomyces narbonensis]GGV97713.1 hypothetical protein GCM10010230_19120 [Streptomyces narbonensis]
MAIEPTPAEQALIDQYALPWIEANEDRSSATDVNLRSYAASLEADGIRGTKAVQRLLSSGRSEALTALEEHWSRVKGCFDQTTRAALAITAEIQACGDTIAIGKHRAQDLMVPLASPPAGASTDSQLTLLQQRQADITRQDLRQNAATTLSETEAGAARAQADPDVATLATVPGTVARLLGGAGGGIGRGIGTGVAPGIAGAGIGGAGGLDGIAGGGASGASGGMGRGIAAAGGPAQGNPQVGTNAGNWNIFVDHNEHKRAADGLSAAAELIYGTTTPVLARAQYDLDTLAASGSLGASVAADYAPLLDHLDSATRALADHLNGPLRDLVLSMSTDQQKTDEDNRDRFGRLR